MKPADHIARAAELFAAGRPRYWAKPDERQSLRGLHHHLSAWNRKLGYGWRFNKDRNAVMVSPPKGK